MSQQEGQKWKKAVDPVFLDYKKDMLGKGLKASRSMDTFSSSGNAWLIGQPRKRI